jgi:hypothetical protein
VRARTRTKSIEQLASTLEKSLKDEDKLRAAISKLQVETKAVSELFQASTGNRKSPRES